MPVPNTYLTMEWYGYRDPLPISEARRCIETASAKAAGHVVSGDWNIPLGSDPHSYVDGNVELWLKLQPDETLSWLHWLEVLFSFEQYGQENMWRGTQFVMLWLSPGEDYVVAFGHLLAQ